MMGRTKHGLNGSPLYWSYHSMLQRCYNPKHHAFPRYGGAGVTVCERWLSDFRNFAADMGARPVGMTLDRKENDRGYSPDNCRWADANTQNTNRRTTRWIEHNGQRLSLAEWARQTGIDERTLTGRLRKGWSVSEALETAAGAKGNQHGSRARTVALKA